jgi:AcrR family transcriptional regulator
MPRSTRIKPDHRTADAAAALRAAAATPRKRTAVSRKLRHRAVDRQLLLEHAERAFSRSGYHAASIRQIARDAGFSVGGVYQFVRSKDDLYLQVIQEQWRQFMDLVCVAPADGGAVDRLVGFAGATFRYFEARRTFFQIYLADRARFPSAFKDKVAVHVRRNHRLLRQLVAEMMCQGMDQGVIGKNDSGFLASAFLGILQNSILDAMNDRSGFEAAGRAESLVTLFLYGAFAPGSCKCSNAAD